MRLAGTVAGPHPALLRAQVGALLPRQGPHRHHRLHREPRRQERRRRQVRRHLQPHVRTQVRTGISGLPIFKSAAHHVRHGADGVRGDCRPRLRHPGGEGLPEQRRCTQHFLFQDSGGEAQERR